MDEIRVPTAVEIDELVSAAMRICEPGRASQTLPQGIVFSAYSAIRLGEWLAVEWGDVDGDECLISKQLRRDGAIVPPKNGRARVVYLPPSARNALDALDPYGSLEQRICGYSRREHTRVWGLVKEEAGFEGRWHDLRHYGATYLLELGLDDWDVSLQMGHRDGGKLVRERYGHKSPARARERMRVATAGELESVGAFGGR